MESFPALQVQGEKAVLFSLSLGSSPFIHNKKCGSKCGVLDVSYSERRPLFGRLQVRLVLGQFSLLGSADIP